MIRKLLFIPLLITVLSACSLNADQEASLRTAVNEYIDARNNNRTSIWVRMTYPDAVRYYKNKSDEVFIKHFGAEGNQFFYQDGSIVQVESEGNIIHVEYEYDILWEEKTEVFVDQTKVYAISVDDGKHWKFLESEEYRNDKILPDKKRLIH